MTRRVLITASRVWTDRTTIWSALNAQLIEFGSLIVVHGDCRVRGEPAGGDDIADRWAWGMREAGYDVTPEPHPAADFEAAHGPKRAPLVRNQHMVSLGADVCLAFPLDGSTGTRHCMTRAYAAGIPVINFGYLPYSQQAIEFARAYG